MLGVDVRDPRLPRIATTVDIRSQTGGAVADLVVRDERLYVLARVGSTAEPVGGRNLPQNQIQVFDLSLGAQPLRVQTIKVPADYVRDDGDLIWDNDLLWARISGEPLRAWREEGAGLAPALEGELKGCYVPVGFTIHQGRAYASCTTGFADNLAVMVFDLRQGPEFLRLATGGGSYDDPGLYSPAIALSAGTLWVSDRAGRLRGLDVGAGGAAPSLRPQGQLMLVGSLSRLDWDAARQRLVAVASDGLVPIDVADPGLPLVGPVLAGGFHMGQLDADGDRLAIALAGDWAAMIDDLGRIGPQDRFGLSVVDLRTGMRRDLEVPLPVNDSFNIDMQIAGDTLWMALARADRETAAGALQILRVDLADPAGLKLELAWEETIAGGYSSSVQLRISQSADTLFLSHSPDPVRVFATQPGGLRPRAILDPALERYARISDLVITPDGDRVFLAAGAGGLISFERPAGGWEAFPTPGPATATVTATATPTPSATMVVRSRKWLPRLGRP